MKRIILLRHAKSSWNVAGLSDHERPLNKRGKAASPKIGSWLQSNGYLPDLILCSTAIRAQETVDRLGFPEQVPVVYAKHLYLADPMHLLQALRGVEDQHDCVMITGHQPGLSTFARLLSPDAAPNCAQAFEHFPTAAAGVFQTDNKTWGQLEAGQAAFIDFAKPRDLDGQ